MSSPTRLLLTMCSCMCLPVLDVREAELLRINQPEEYHRRSMQSMAKHVQAMLEFKRRGAEVFDYGNNLRQRAFDEGVAGCFRISRVRPCLYPSTIL